MTLKPDTAGHLKLTEATGAPWQRGATSRRPGESREDMYAMVKTWYMHVVYKVVPQFVS